MAALDTRALLRLEDVAIACGLADTDKRSLLLGDLPRELVATLPEHRNPADQLRSDLQVLNGRTSALVLWLERAVALTRLDSASAPIRKALAELRDARPPPHPEGTAAQPPRWLQWSIVGTVCLGAIGLTALVFAPDEEPPPELPPMPPDARPPESSPSDVLTPPNRPTLPDGFVALPGGPAILGCSPPREAIECFDDEIATPVNVAPYALHRHEVTSGAYAQCVEANACTPTSDGPGCTGPHRDARPINCVSWFQARRYCEWIDARLPTEAEWEAAARGPDGLDFPWGREVPDRCEAVITRECRDAESPPPIHRRGGADTRAGIYGLGGGVREWVEHEPAVYAYPRLGDDRAINRGASWRVDRAELARSNAHTRHEDRITDRRPEVGFRCARDWPEADR